MFCETSSDYSFVSSPASSVSSPKSSPSFKPHAKFTSEEDQILKNLVEQYGEDNWATIASMMYNRNPRQCRERYQYYLSPKLNRGEWAEEEDNLLRAKVEEFGNKWVKISKFFPSRTDAMVKNRYQVLLRRQNKQQRKLKRMPQQISVNTLPEHKYQITSQSPQSPVHIMPMNVMPEPMIDTHHEEMTYENEINELQLFETDFTFDFADTGFFEADLLSL